MDDGDKEKEEKRKKQYESTKRCRANKKVKKEADEKRMEELKKENEKIEQSKAACQQVKWGGVY